MANRQLTLNEFWTVGPLQPDSVKFPSERSALEAAEGDISQVFRWGAQKDFVHGDEKYSAYIGGLGSGKTWAGIARGLKYSLQPKPKGTFHAPHGIIAVSSYPALNDIIVPKLQEIMSITGLAEWDKDYAKAKKELTLINGAIIRLRSLDNPEVVARGPEYAWFFIDEGRNVGITAWQNLCSRLRQPGYKRAGFVASTPNGYDWMHDVFAPDGARHEAEYPRAKWYNAPMFENLHLDSDYVTAQAGQWSGRWYNQEVLGEFMGIVEGGVFPEWDPVDDCNDEHDFDPELPLFTCWDFGIGDPGTCLFFQVSWEPQVSGPPNNQRVRYFPFLRVLDLIEAKDWTAKDWAEAYKAKLTHRFKGARPAGDYGDPSGMNRQPGSGTSVILDLNSYGVPVVPVKRYTHDYALRILSNMMAAGRVSVNKTHAKRVSDAFASHKWHMKDGVRIGTKPVHDWTSHIVDAMRYGAAVTLQFGAREDSPVKAQQAYEPQQWGYVFEQLEQGNKRLEFVPQIGQPHASA